MFQIVSHFTLVPRPTASAAVVSVNTYFEKGFTGSPASPQSFVSNAGTVAGTVAANANRVMICMVQFRAASSVTATPSWNGVAMTAINSINSDATSDYVGLWGLKNPASGNQSLSLTFTGTITNFSLGAICFDNADQVTGWVDRGWTTGTSTGVTSTISTGAGNAVLHFIANNNSAGAITTSPGTQIYTDTAFQGNAIAAYKLSTSSSETITTGWVTSAIQYVIGTVDILHA